MPSQSHEGMSPTADDEARAAWSEAARLKSALSQCGARAAETRRREVAVRLERDQLRTRLDDLEAVCRRLLAAYEVEEREDGFPFNFELRAAHRDLRALVGDDCPDCEGVGFTLFEAFLTADGEVPSPCPRCGGARGDLGGSAA